MALKEKIKQNPALKQAVHRFIMHPVKTLVDTSILFPLPKTWKRLCDLP